VSLILFAHGLEGSPQGRKPAAMRAAGLDPMVPDCRGMPLAERVATLESVLAGRTEVLLVGSSYGGLASMVLVSRDPGRFRGLVLCAPALNWREHPAEAPDQLTVPPSLPCVVLHGRHDQVVPLAVSQRLVRRSGPHVELLELDDDHGLSASIPTLLDAIRRLDR